MEDTIMEIIRCANGHFYDAEQCSSCPTCAKEQGGASPFVFDNESTVPLGVTAPTAPVTPVDDIGATVPLGGGSASGGVSDIMGTAAFRSGVPNVTVPINQPNPGVGAQDYGVTTPVVPAGWVKDNAGAAEQNVPFRPVVGWLVCIEGNSKGADYRIHSQNNFIGRGQHMDICITGDNTISAERAAVIAYDDRENMFFFGIGNGHNLVYVNGKVTLNTVVLQPFDELTIGETKLLFVPLCSERFTWNGR